MIPFDSYPWMNMMVFYFKKSVLNTNSSSILPTLCGPDSIGGLAPALVGTALPEQLASPWRLLPLLLAARPGAAAALRRGAPLKASAPGGPRALLAHRHAGAGKRRHVVPRKWKAFEGSLRLLMHIKAF